jgi:Holliday junction DNA helicase RuvA
MIGRLSGTLVSKAPPQILVDVAGVGYDLDVPMSTFYDLPATGERVVLLTHQAIREDAHMLYGFLTESERSTFRALIRISGVGPRLALAVLSGLSVHDLTQAIAAQEAGRLTKIPGIGKKTAERLLLELKGQLGSLTPGAARDQTPLEHSSDIVRALLALGYSEREATVVVRGLPPDLGVSEGIKQALQRLARG